MALKPADMSSCSPKKRCLWGDNEGVAYDPSDPCPSWQEFDPATCDCSGCDSQWLITYREGDGSPGNAGCRVEDCAPNERTKVSQQVFNFGSNCVSLIGGMHFCSISDACPQGPVDCGGTWKSRFGWEELWFSDTSRLPGTADVFCGQSDMAVAEFRVISSDRYPEGSKIAAFLAGGWGGAVGCCFYQNEFLDAIPAASCTTSSATISWKVSYATYGAGCTPQTADCFAFGGNPYTFQVSDLADGGTISVSTRQTDVTGTCSGTWNTEVIATYPTCVGGAIAFKTVVLGSPGCSVNISAGAIATPYDVSIDYA